MSSFTFINVAMTCLGGGGDPVTFFQGELAHFFLRLHITVEVGLRPEVRLGSLLHVRGQVERELVQP